MIGRITPPVRVLMFVASSVSKTHLGLIGREIGPFVLALLVALLVGLMVGLMVALMAIRYLPWLSLWLPRLLDH